MPRITIHLPSLLADSLQLKEFSVEAETLSGAIAAIKRDQPRVATHVFTDHGDQRRHVLLFLNDRDTRWLDPADPALKDGDRIEIIQAISGGIDPV